MWIPLNTKQRNDLGLSIIAKKKGDQPWYSVAIMSIKNGFGLDDLPSWMYYYPDDPEEFLGPVVWMEDYKIITGPDLMECIKGCMEQIKNLMY